MNVNAKRPKAVNGSLAPPGVGASTHLSVCKRCGTTVFTWQPWEFLRDPLGIVHASADDCWQATP